MAIVYAQEQRLSAADYASVMQHNVMGQHRPLANESRIQAMLDNSNFIVTARDDGALLGLARCITDFNWCAYCIDLAVRDDQQGRGIGKAIMARCIELLGPRVSFYLTAFPEAVPFYEAIGMQPNANSFVIYRTDRN